MKLTVCITLLGLVLGGCASVTHVSHSGRRGTISEATCNEDLRYEEVTILFKGGSVADGIGFRITGDTASWKSLDDGTSFRSPIDSIRRVSKHPNRLVGALVGFGIGLAGGGLAGLVFSSGTASHSEDRGLEIALTTAVGGVAGAIFGAVTGAVAMPPEEYDFDRRESEE